MADISRRFLSVQDLQNGAKRYLPRVIYDYLEGGADDEICLDENANGLRRYKFRPSYLVDISTRSQQVQVFGQTYASPIGIAPMGMLSMVRHEGDITLAEVANHANIPFILSGASNASIEEIAAVAPHAWVQYYPCKDPAMEHDLLERMTKVGISTLVVTVDVPLHSKRERNMRSGWVRPYKPTPAVMLESLRHPAWVAAYLRNGLPVMKNFLPYAQPGISARDLTSFYAGQVPAPHEWSLLQRLREKWPGNLVVKGILSSEDARRCVDAGVDGLIVSNHGGRQLDRSMASVDALPSIVEAVKDNLTVMFDSGIRRGSDVAVAMSLGARLCFVGRAAAYGLAAHGKPGAQRAIAILQHELDLAQGQIGCANVQDLAARNLWQQKFQAGSDQAASHY